MVDKKKPEINKYGEVIQVRLPPQMVKKINEIVEKGEYSSRQDFIRYKLRQVLKEYGN